MPATSFERSRINVLLLEGVHPSATETFRAAGYTSIQALPDALDPTRHAEALRRAHLLGIRSRSQLTAEALATAERLVAIGCFCIGTNQVDLAEARQRGIPVFNAPFSNTRSVAELIIAEAILLLRGIPAKSNAAHRGQWLKTARNAHEIRGKTIGIVGYGNIGTQVGILAEALGMQVCFHDHTSKLALGNAVAMPSLEALLKTADIVTLHVPQTEGTRNLINRDRLALMKPGAVLLNASRGTVVDLQALAAALRDDRLSGAAIDVYPTEPTNNDQPFDSPLRGIDQCLLTPHIGGSTVEAQENIGAEVAAKLVKYSDNGSTLMSVNFPEVALPEHPASHRLLHIHRNIPGVLSSINDIFRDLGVNISGQYLQTRDGLGYVVVDVDSEYSARARRLLDEVEGTIRTRILF